MLAPCALLTTARLPLPALGDGGIELALGATFAAVVAGVLAVAWSARRSSFLLILVALVGIVVSAGEAIRFDREDHLRDEHQRVANGLMDVRARLEHVVNTEMNRLEALAAYIALDPHLDASRFAEVARQLLVGHAHLRNLSAAPDLVVRYVYPSQGNEGVVGLDYRANPAQRDAALHAVEARAPVIAGPVDLVQGGRGLVARLPVFLPDDAGVPVRGSLWGLVATVIDLEELLAAAGLAGHEDLSVALRGRDATGPEGPVFHGDPVLFADGSEQLSVSLPVGSWGLAARPVGGWEDHAPAAPWVVGATLIVVAAILGLWWTRHRQIVERMRAETELRTARDAALAATRAKSRFLANMSHEIRTPMNGVLGAAQLLDDTSLDGAQRELADIIQASARSLLTVLDDVLDLAKIEAGRLGVVAEPVEVRRLVSEVVDLTRKLASARALRLEVRWPSDLPRWFLTDPIRVRQILLNLLSNACKFTESGSVTVSASRLEEGGEAWLRLDVADTGIGMTPEQLARIFQPFEQADDTTTRRFGGTGLGTSIARELAQLLGGRLRADSRPGEGSVFQFDIPWRETDASTEPVPPKTRTRLAGRVLLAEDGLVNARVATLFLEGLGLDVEHVLDGEATLAAAPRADLVLMDVQMPKMDGLEATRRLRARGYLRPIVALTASKLPEDVTACREAGMDDVLGKPLLREELERALARHLGVG